MTDAILDIAATELRLHDTPYKLICGDFNAHHPVWDSIQPEDHRGTELLEWSCTSDLTILNSGIPTRHSRSTGNGGSPDVTMVGKAWSDHCSWAIDPEEIGGSDHLPIIITLNVKVFHQPIIGASPRWRSNGIKWAEFRKEVDTPSCPTLFIAS